MNLFGSLKEKVTQYTSVYVDLLKLNMISKTTSVLSYLMFAFIGIFLLFGVMLFFGFGLVESFVALGVARVGAFFITFGVFVILLLVLMGLRKSITRFFSGVFIRILTEGDNETETND